MSYLTAIITYIFMLSPVLVPGVIIGFHAIAEDDPGLEIWAPPA